MQAICPLSCVRLGALLALGLVLGASNATASIRLIRVDLHDRLFADQLPTQSDDVRISVPRGAPAVFQFAVTSDKAGAAEVSVSPVSRGVMGRKLKGEPKLHVLLPVHVEANTQGSLTNRPGGRVPEGWMKHLVRAAPFDALEVVIESHEFSLKTATTHGLLLEVFIPTNAMPGEYRGNLTVRQGRDSATAGFRFRVYDTVLPQVQSMHSVPLALARAGEPYTRQRSGMVERTPLGTPGELRAAVAAFWRRHALHSAGQLQRASDSNQRPV